MPRQVMPGHAGAFRAGIPAGASAAPGATGAEVAPGPARGRRASAQRPVSTGGPVRQEPCSLSGRPSRSCGRIWLIARFQLVTGCSETKTTSLGRISNWVATARFTAFSALR